MIEEYLSLRLSDWPFLDWLSFSDWLSLSDWLSSYWLKPLLPTLNSLYTLLWPWLNASPAQKVGFFQAYAFSLFSFLFLLNILISITSCLLSLFLILSYSQSDLSLVHYFLVFFLSNGKISMVPILNLICILSTISFGCLSNSTKFYLSLFLNPS
jgi:hypothetical protein